MTRASRVSSPRAAKRLARLAGSMLCDWTLGDMGFDVLHLAGPAFLVHAEGFVAAVGGDLVEAGFYDFEEGSGGGWLEGELDQRGCLLGVVDFGVDAVGVPGEGEVVLGLDLLDGGVPLEVFVAGPGHVAG